MNIQEKLDGFTIQDLLSSEKVITKKVPKQGLSQKGSHFRADLDLEATDIDAKFRVFIRQHSVFTENFSIGLDYKASSGTVTLIRFNGPHKTTPDPIDNHHYNSHIHIETGDPESQNTLDDIEITAEYEDFNSAISFAMREMRVNNYEAYFPDINQLTISMEE